MTKQPKLPDMIIDQTPGPIVLPMIKVVRNKFPNTIQHTLGQEWPEIPQEPVEYETDQIVEIFDPREVLSEDPNFAETHTQVLIIRSQRKIPKNKHGDYLVRLIQSKQIEVLRAYSFEEWDSGLVWKE